MKKLSQKWDFQYFKWGFFINIKCATFCYIWPDFGGIEFSNLLSKNAITIGPIIWIEFQQFLYILTAPKQVFRELLRVKCVLRGSQSLRELLVLDSNGGIKRGSERQFWSDWSAELRNALWLVEISASIWLVKYPRGYTTFDQSNGCAYFDQWECFSARKCIWRLQCVLLDIGFWQISKF